MHKRVVITGMGLVSPLGQDLETFWGNLLAGTSGIGHITRFDTTGYTTRIGAEINDFSPEQYMDKKLARRSDRFTQFGLAASLMALEHAGLNGKVKPDRAGVLFGTGIGGIETLCDQYQVLLQRGPDRVSPFFIPTMIANMAAATIAMHAGLRGPNVTVVTACASAANAVGDAFKMIQRGSADVMLAGGSEAPFVPLAFAGFCSMRAMSTRNDDPAGAMRPFDAGRDGFVMGEGAGMLVLESEEHALGRGARILGEVCGYGTTADAYHITAPSPDGDGAARAMQDALDDAGLSPGDIQYINAHGTSTPANDRVETMAIKTVFGQHAPGIPVSSTKSMIGHLLGAAGAVELIATVLTMLEGIIPPTINQTEPDPECDLDSVPNVARRHQVHAALSNSFGFGGQNVSLAVRRYPC
ncbi:MAG: beta-ketoacyl-ACP synthase II [Bacillota bacterium]